ncbi:MAG TPA: substrate-binding domain-containing protein, partial [Chitinophagaceae bacterium]|nr:substrate-binding domain-containing protein [Chitinophagaceae bacterium]
ALKDHKIPFENKLVHISRLNDEAGIEAANFILKQKNNLPDGVFAANDTAAVYCMMKLMENGIKIPGDIAFVGFNNDPISNIIEPKLSSINYSGYDIGHTAVSNLINHLRGISNIKTTNRIILRSDLIIRSSSLKNKNL